MDAQTAQQIAEQKFASLKERGEDIVVKLKAETKYGWMFYYQSARFLQTHDRDDCLIGNGPMIVMKDNGAVFLLGSSYPWDVEVKRFEATHLAPEEWPAEHRHEYLCIRFGDAARYGEIDVLQACLDDGVSMEEPDSVTRMTALERAVMAYEEEAVGFLLNAGADVNRQDQWGETPLMIASSGGKSTMVRLLLQARADVLACNSKDEMAVSLSDNPTVTKMLWRATLWATVRRCWQILVTGK